MNAVYFGLDLIAKAPHLMACLCVDAPGPERKWVGFPDLLQAMERGEEVHIRPASATEMKRAADLIGFDRLIYQVSDRISDLFDGYDPEQVAELKKRIAEAINSIQFSLLDQE